ncbi:hypothetical protein EGR_10978 [Echinococcus granulosus]|uniref:Uncharacterized protein n=1 Tax=Echinococcus granulosus TaxID=6210 RepID=W6TZC9_ECHGR|nr:hypothetical protein EGR_10978 [Echinococcus granulosus]EUB54160.1 hypothetical protein EGR_10978 [Echinococcus granulosus]
MSFDIFTTDLLPPLAESGTPSSPETLPIVKFYQLTHVPAVSSSQHFLPLTT